MPTPPSFVMTVIGPDRPGLVEALASLIRQHHGNWLESRLCQLGGRFAGLLRASIPAPQHQAFLAALAQLESTTGLSITAQPDSGQTHTHPSPATLRLTLVGHDQPGIIRQISAALARHAVNVESLDTRTESAPMAGGTLFHAEAILRLPAHCEPNALRATLEEIASELMVDLALTENHSS